MATNNSFGSSPTPAARDYLLIRVTKGSLTGLIFYTVFFLIFTLSGLLSILSIIKGFPYRMALVSALVLPLILLYGIRINKIFITYGLLTLIVFLSGLYNGTTVDGILLFMRTLVFSYLIFRLVEIYLRPANVHRVINWCVVISVLQLPVLLMQRLSFAYWPAIVRQNIDRIDADFGTFNFKGDAPMAFFLTSIILFLLFDKNRMHTVRYKWIILGWLTLTVFITNAEVMKITIFLFWAIYFFTHAKAKVILYSMAVFIAIFGLLAVSGSLNQVWSHFRYNLETNARLNVNTEQNFLAGNYARGTAIAYYLNQKISLLGDGPSRYYNALSKTRLLGNTGHIFTFYSEVGLLGWLASTAIFFLIAFPIHRSRIKIGWAPLLMFLSIQLLSLTSEIMNDVSIVLAYCIITQAYSILTHQPANKPDTAPGNASYDLPSSTSQ